MKIGLLVPVAAKPPYADQFEAALRGAQELAEQEQDRAASFALR